MIEMQYCVHVSAALYAVAGTDAEFLDLMSAVTDELTRRATLHGLVPGDTGCGFGCRDIEFGASDRDVAQAFVAELGREIALPIGSSTKLVPVTAGVFDDMLTEADFECAQDGDG